MSQLSECFESREKKNGKIRKASKRGRESFFIDSQSLSSDDQGVDQKRLKSLARKAPRDYAEPLCRVCQIDG
jgi:hypothetical protein